MLNQLTNQLKSLSSHEAALVVFVGVFVMVAPACLRQWKQVDTPPALVDQGVAAKVSLADVPMKQQQVADQFALWMSQWDASEAHAEDQIRFLEGVIDVAKDPATLTSFGLNPAGGVLSSLLLLGGLLTPLPGHARSKRDSYNKGAEDARKLIEVGKEIAGTDT